jgi:tetratricopeptide (TPR) repeat protein
LAEVKALRDIGQWKKALGLAQSLATDARAVGYEPLLAEVLSVRSWLEQESGDPAKAVTTLEEAVWKALGSRRDDIAAESTAQLVAINGYHLSRFADAERWDRAADELVRRLGPGHDRISAWLHQDRADAAERRGDTKTALGEMQMALALKRKALPPDHPDIGISEYSLSLTYVLLGNAREALAAADRAVAIYRSAYGDQSPQLWVVLDTRAEALELLGRYEEAEKDLRVSIARAEELFGVGHVWTAVALVDLGKVLLDEGKPTLAVPILEKTVRIRDQSEPNPENVAEAHFALARALWSATAGQDRPRALALATTARDSYRALPGHQKELTAVDAWLASK